MNAHRIETSLTENGSLSLRNLPFKKGDEVEIIILDRNRSLSKIISDSNALRGTVLCYDAPLEPAASAEDWDAMQ